MKARLARRRLRLRVANALILVALAAFWWGMTALVIHSLPTNTPY